MNNRDSRENRIEHARAYLNEAIEQNTNFSIGVGGFGFLLIVIFIYALRTEGTDIFIDAIGGLLLMALVLVLCVGLLYTGLDETKRYKKLLQDVDGNLDEIERIESEAKRRVQKSKAPSNKTYTESRPLWYYAYGEHGWRKTIPHSEYSKYHIRLEDYETEYEYEDALRKAKNHYDKLHK